LNKTKDETVIINKSESCEIKNLKNVKKVSSPINHLPKVNYSSLLQLSKNIKNNNSCLVEERKSIKDTLIMNKDNAYVHIHTLAHGHDINFNHESKILNESKKTFSPNNNNRLSKSPNKVLVGRHKSTTPILNLKNNYSKQYNKIDKFFLNLENYNKNIESRVDSNTYSISKILDIFNFRELIDLAGEFGSDINIINNLNSSNNTNCIINTNNSSKYNHIWNKFLSSILNITSAVISSVNKNANINYINNYNIPKLNDNFNDKLKSDFKIKLEEKDKEIEDINFQLINKDKYIKDLENILNDINFKVGGPKDIKDVNESLEGVNFYSHKQLLRDYKELSLENKNLREVNNRLDKDLKLKKEKEVKIMRLLYYLNKNGIPIEDLMENEIKNFKTDSEGGYGESADNNYDNFSIEVDEDLNSVYSDNKAMKSLDRTMYTPIYIDPPKQVTKNDKIPILNLHHINDNYNTEYLSPVKNGTFNNYNTVNNTLHDDQANSLYKLNILQTEENFNKKLKINNKLKSLNVSQDFK
jgi:hypothetical protein